MAVAAQKELGLSLTMNGVVTWHQGRCGSSVLGSLLNQHSRIQAQNEIFSGYMPRRWGEKPVPPMPGYLFKVGPPSAARLPPARGTIVTCPAPHPPLVSTVRGRQGRRPRAWPT